MDIDSGRLEETQKHSPPSQHFTIIFNTFVMMTLFNEINSRKIHGQRNILSGLRRNPVFCGIWIGTLISQIIIIEVGGFAFSTKGLSLDQWLWCLLLGIGALIWGQIITTIPTHKLPHICAWGRTTQRQLDMDEVDVGKTDSSPMADDHVGGRGQILWVRGLTRLQQQIRVVNAFQMDLDTHLDSYDKRSRPSVASLPSLQLRSGPFKKNNLPNSPEAESPNKPYLNRAESIPYADEP